MEEEIMALAATAGGTLATLLATDSWNRVKSAVLAFWKHRNPQSLPEIEGSLEHARLQLDSNPEQRDAIIRGLSEHIVSLLTNSPAPEAQLRSFVDALKSSPPQTSTRDIHVDINATTNDQGTTNILGQGEMRVGDL
jgi:hypothetical protein